MNHPPAFLAKSLIAFLLFVFCAAPLQAQGTMGQVADPMSGKELAVYLKRYVQPSFEQWTFIEDSQGGYLEKFAELRDGLIADFLQETQEINRSGGMPDIEAVRKYMVTQAKVRARIRRLDDQFFDSIAAVLRPEQMAGLERARLARKRARLQSGIVVQMGMGRVMDLWTHLDDMDLDDEEYEVILLRIKPYEEKSARLLSKGWDAGASILLMIIEEIEASGLGDIDFNDPANRTPEIMQEVMEAYRAGYQVAVKKSGSVATKIRELNSRTLRDLTLVIDPWKTRQLKSDYLIRSMGGMMLRQVQQAFMDSETAEEVSQFELLVKGLRGKDELLGDLREPFDELLLAFVLEDHKRLDRILQLSQEFDPLMQQLAQAQEAFGGEEPVEGDREPTISDRIAEIQLARTKAQAERSRQLFALIESKGSDELKAAVEEPLALAKYGDPPTPGDEQVLEIYESDAVIEEGAVLSTGIVTETRGWAPEAMGIKILGKVRRRVDDEVWLQAVLETLHEEYLEEWESQVAPLSTQMLEAESSIYSWDFETKTRSFNETAFKRLYELRAAVMENAGRVDDRFFENLVLAMSDDAADAMRVLRAERAFERALAGTASGSMPSGVMGGAGQANPITVLHELELDEDEWLLVDRAILTNQKDMIEAHKALQVVQLENERAMAEIQSNMTAQDSESGNEGQMSAMMEYQRLWRENAERLKPIQLNAKEKREAFFKEISTLLPEETNQKFIVAYRMASFPSIYRDQASAKPALEAALALADLSPEQEQQIADMLAKYEKEWLERSHRMADATSEFTQGDFSTQEGQQIWMNANMKVERARFDRDELSGRTLRRLARLLRADQRRHVHALRGIEEELGEEVSPAGGTTVNAE